MVKDKDTKSTEFERKAKLVHPDKNYDYSPTIYVSAKDVVTIGCPKHGIFTQVASYHLSGRGCKKCAGFDLSNDEFISDVQEIHNYKYGYTETNYINWKHKIKVRCYIHGLFDILPDNHKRGKGCPKCCGKGFTQDEMIDIFNNIHNYRYDYNNFHYIDNKTESIIICDIHGEFNQTPTVHLRGSGCPKCAGRGLSNNEIINRFISIHGNKYDYSKFIYKGPKIKCEIICKVHKSFYLTADEHYRGKGCKHCKISKGERQISNWLDSKGIKYTREVTFNGCSYIQNLFFDFYLPNLNMCVEYDGKQHFKPIDYFGGVEAFEKTKIRDNIKSDFCIENDIKLLRIPYWDFRNIDSILEKEIK